MSVLLVKVSEKMDNMSSEDGLEFHSAMKDFKIMFPGLNDDIIESVLRSHDGVVEATIDHLLRMHSDSKEDMKVNGSPTPKACHLVENDYCPSSSYRNLSPVAKKVAERYHYRRSLPDEFLRISLESDEETNFRRHNETAHSSFRRSLNAIKTKVEENIRRRSSLNDNSENDRVTKQFLDDEQFATMLQNDELMCEMNQNEIESRKTKLTAAAKQFFAKKKSNRPSVLKDNSSPSSFNLLENEEDSDQKIINSGS
ncbi:DgyrCDS14216 [Dimorphilus gyrociliatus]|uniref:DgyrCDS14216 n=1 Tax=Dimorphilus gyrociliatus TaxID=2664684 RepID=A0A7I8WDC1_9ANNE|nr:DgyrCDS14216 [Dimorphilus gyrociliatus]